MIAQGSTLVVLLDRLLVRHDGFLPTLGMKALEAHALEVFLLQAGSLLDVHLLRVEVEVGKHWSMI
jgi:hypothetical protein